MANGGQKLVFEGSPSETMENVNIRLDWRSPKSSGGSYDNCLGVQVYVPVF